MSKEQTAPVRCITEAQLQRDDMNYERTAWLVFRFAKSIILTIAYKVCKPYARLIRCIKYKKQKSPSHLSASIPLGPNLQASAPVICLAVGRPQSKKALTEPERRAPIREADEFL